MPAVINAVCGYPFTGRFHVISPGGTRNAATASAVSGVTAATAIFSGKIRCTTDRLRSMAASGIASYLITDSDGDISGSSLKVEIYAHTNAGPTTMSWVLHGYSTGTTSLHTTTVTPVLISTLPLATADHILYFEWNNTAKQVLLFIFDEFGTIVASQSDTGTAYGALNGVGFVTLGDSPSSNIGPTCSWNGIALYNVALTGAQRWSPPATSDTGIIYLCQMNDKTSGVTPTTMAAQVGSPGLTIDLTATSGWNYATKGIWGGHRNAF